MASPSNSSSGALVTKDLEIDSHELVRVIRSDASGLVAVIAVHSTAMGPSMGGVRRQNYASLNLAIDDALRLSHAMTLKNSVAGLPLGGGKSVIVDASSEPSNAMLDSFADAVENLGGRYVAAEDIGTTPRHMDRLARRTHWVAGRSREAGGNGDPSPATAATVFGAMQAASDLRWGSSDLSRRAVGILGAGKVGGHLAERLEKAGAELLIADVDSQRAEKLASSLPHAKAVATATLFTRYVDILAPCAVGGMIDKGVASSLRASIICGASNNTLAADSVADVLAERGILYVPDFLANAGGIIHVGGGFLGLSLIHI